MSLFSVIVLAFALAMDAFAVALSTGGYLRSVTGRQSFRLSFHFGLFQFLMPLIGWLVGRQIAGFVEGYGPWIAWLLLTTIGVKMFREAGSETPSGARADVTKGASLVALSVATSIDALAVGLSLAVVHTAIVSPSIVIGIVAAVMTILGLRLGERFSHKFGSIVERAGGVVLILLGLKMLVEKSVV